MSDGFDALTLLEGLESGTALDVIEDRLRLIAANMGGDPVTRTVTRERLMPRLKELGVKAPKQMADATLGRPTREASQGRRLQLRDTEPCANPVNGALLLELLVREFKRYVVLPDGAAEAMALLVVHAYAHDAAAISPLAVLSSPTKRCGKTTVLQIVHALVPRPVFTANVSPASLFRSIEAFRPTLLVDEADTFLKLSEEMRGLLNAGHTRAVAMVLRTVGDEHEPRLFSTWAPKWVALIGRLSGTLEDRAIVIPMRRRAPAERVERFRADRIDDTFEPYRQSLARWAADHLDELRKADPVVPEELHDRASDNWRPLLAIADLAGGDWPERARKAARTLSGVENDDSLSVQLLADVREVFQQGGLDRMSSAVLIEKLVQLPERPWPESRPAGKPINDRQLARLLKPFGIGPKVVRIGDSTPRGYDMEGLEDAFERYLPSLGGSDPQQAQQGRENGYLAGNFDPQQDPDVADRKRSLSVRHSSDVADVAAQKGLEENNEGEQL